MSVSILSIDDPRWLAFVSQHPAASAFHHPSWAQLLAECYGYQPVLLSKLGDTGAVVGGLPFLEVKSRLTGNRMVALPFTDFCPPLVPSDAVRDELIELVQAEVRNKIWPRTEVHWPLPDRLGIYPSQPMARHVTRLSADPEEVLRRFKGSVVRLIHQAETAGVVIRRGESWSDLRSFYGLHQETRRRQGTPVQPLHFFRLLWERILSAGIGTVLLAWKDAQPVAAAVFLRWNRTLIYKYGASLPAYWHLRPNNLLFWSAIRWGCESGCEVFDWGKTDLDNEGLRHFKRGWGGKESIVHYSIVADHAPARSPSGPGHILVPVIQRSPIWVGRVVGELLYGHFG